MNESRPTSEASKASLKELALLFFRLGATSFGGPAVHIAMMEDEVVRRRQIYIIENLGEGFRPLALFFHRIAKIPLKACAAIRHLSKYVL